MVLLATVCGYLATAFLLPFVLLLFLVQYAVGNQRLFDPLIRAICRGLPWVFGIRVRVTGAHHLDAAKTYIFMANHVSIFDPVILYGHIPHFVRALELDDHFRWPIWGAIITRAGNVPISHRHTRRALESLRTAADVVRSGTSLVILPEGHRTRTGRMGRFMRGSFRLARSVHTDIVPIALTGLYERQNVHSPRVTPGRVHVAFGRPIPAESFASLDERELLELVRGTLERMLGHSDVAEVPGG